MMLPLEALTGYADRMAGAAVTSAWESAILILCVALCLRLLPRLGAGARSVVWLGALTLVVLLPALPLIFAAHVTSFDGEASGPVRLSEDWGLALVLCWAVLSFVRAAALARSAARLRGILRRSAPVDTGGTVCHRVLNTGRRPAKLCLSAEVDRPSVAGFVRPRVLIPTEMFERLLPAELEQIVRHEMEHLHRRDDWTNLLQKLSLVLFPLNPALVWLDLRLSVERELACDDGVLRQTRARKAYAACLTNLAAHSMVRRGASLALGAWERQTELARRVHRILAWRESGMGRRPASAVTAVLLASVTVGAAMLARVPQLVRFAPLPMTSDLEAPGLPLADRGAGVVPTRAAVDRFAPRPLLVKAMLPEQVPLRPLPTVQRLTHTRQRSHSTTLATRRVGRAAAQHPPTPFVLMTRWQTGSVPVHLTLAVADEEQKPRYAAVRTGDGWLIFEL